MTWRIPRAAVNHGTPCSPPGGPLSRGSLGDVSTSNLSSLSAYDRAAWDEIQDWKNAKSGRSLIPARPRQAIAHAGKAAARIAGDLPGADTIAGTLQRAVEGAFTTVDRISVASVRRSAIIKRFARAGHDVVDLTDIRKLDLRTVDRLRPRVDMRYMIGLAAEGAGAGAAMTGAEALTAGGTVLGVGAGAAPGAGLLITITVADAVAVVSACSRVAAEIGAYYGYDAELPQERIYSMGVLGVAMAETEAAKAAAFQELNKVVQALARKKSWKELDSLVVTKVIKKVMSKYTERMTQRKLGQAVPVLGIIMGASLNAKTLSDVAKAANYVYRERFIADKYSLATSNPAAEGGTLDIVTIIDDELADNADVVDAEIVEDLPPPAASAV